MLTGRPHALTVLDFGLFRVGDTRTIGIPGFLIRTDHGETVLVDTGFPQAYATDADAAAQRDGLAAFGRVLSLSPANLVTGHLALMGLRPCDIDLLVLTHSHIDHVGGLTQFAGKRILIGAAERALPKPLYWGDARPLAWPAATYVEIAQDTEIAPGFHCLYVPGHTPGQLALHLTLPQTGPVLLTSDAISRAAEVEDGFAGADDPALARTSAARLLALADRSVVIWGHCPDQWNSLRKAPNSYF